MERLRRVGATGGRTAAVALSLALLVALPLVAAHIAGAASAARVGARAALIVVDAEGASVMLSDGSARSAVPWLRAGDTGLAVSPSGRQLAFSSARTGNAELYVADLDDGSLARLTFTPRREDVEPTWSPDGSRLAWASGTETNHDLHVVRADRTRFRRLTRGTADDREPAWSPDGRTVAFASNELGAFDLWLVPARGGRRQVLADARGDARAPDWHPSGTRLAFTSVIGGAADVWLARRNGSTRPLIRAAAYDGRPDWSPDGLELAFVRGWNGSLRPWRARANGTDAEPVPGPRRGARELVWARVGAQLAPARTALLPDLDQRAPTDLVVRTIGDGHFRLGFTSATDNVGLGPVWLRGRRSTTIAPLRVEQLVRDESGAIRALRGVGLLRYERHPPHRHWHLDDFVRYELRTPDGRVVVRDRKSGFCLIDRWGFARPLRGRPRALPRFVGDCGTLQPNALRVEQGSSVGYTDRYPAFFHGQDLDLTGLPGGLYVLVQTANPERRLREVDYTNNAASVLVRLSWLGGRAAPPRVTALETCGGSGSCRPRDLRSLSG